MMYVKSVFNISAYLRKKYEKHLTPLQRHDAIELKGQSKVLDLCKLGTKV